VGKGQRIAKLAADKLYGSDQASQMLGMTIDSIAPGSAQVSMRVRPNMVNGHGICHGGLIFALADSAFAFACNSHGHNTVAAGAAIEFLAPGRIGDLLTATASERALARRAQRHLRNRGPQRSRRGRRAVPRPEPPGCGEAGR